MAIIGEKQHQLRQKSERQMTILKYALMVPTYGILKPLVWGLDKLGYAEGMFKAYQAKLAEEFAVEKSFEGYEPTEADVFVCAYVKSGTNWTLQMAHEIANRGNGEFEHIHDVIPWPDGMKGYSVDLSDPTGRELSPTGLRVIKTHLAFQFLPYSPKARYICVIRDPKDVFVSGYHFFRDCYFGPLMPSVQTFLNSFLSESFVFDTWAKNAASYWSVRDKENVLFQTYRDMKQDPQGIIRRIADLMRVGLTEKELAAVRKKSSFGYMRSVDERFYPGMLTPWSTRQGKMMRKGKAGTSSDLLSPAQQAQIDAYCKDELHRLQSDLPYEEFFGKRNEQKLQPVGQLGGRLSKMNLELTMSGS